MQEGARGCKRMQEDSVPREVSVPLGVSVSQEACAADAFYYKTL
jgi:hypothetical protein